MNTLEDFEAGLHFQYVSAQQTAEYFSSNLQYRTSETSTVIITQTYR